jgi:hypothetical protein
MANMAWTPGRSARIIVAGAAMVVLLVGPAPPPVSGWGNGGNAGNGYGTHDWVVDQALDILDAAGRRPAWFDRALALPYTDDPDTIERAQDSSRGWEHVYYDMTVHGGAVQRISEHYTAALESTVDTRLIRNHRFKVVVDYAYGSTSFVMPNVLSKLGGN